jgi:micrococcal nuclease
MTQIRLKLSRLFIAVLFLGAGFLAGYYWPASSNSSLQWKVERVIDGDTLEVSREGEIERVRLIGLDTPEISHSSAEVNECFGPEASDYLQSLLAGKSIYLLPDPLTSERDQYQRLLSYVFLEDGTLVNAQLIEEGYAFLYIYEPFQFMKQFDYWEKKARIERKGLWGEECSYYFE